MILPDARPAFSAAAAFCRGQRILPLTASRSHAKSNSSRPFRDALPRCPCKQENSQVGIRATSRSACGGDGARRRLDATRTAPRLGGGHRRATHRLRAGRVGAPARAGCDGYPYRPRPEGPVSTREPGSGRASRGGACARSSPARAGDARPAAGRWPRGGRARLRRPRDRPVTSGDTCGVSPHGAERSRSPGTSPSGHDPATNGSLRLDGSPGRVEPQRGRLAGRVDIK